MDDETYRVYREQRKRFVDAERAHPYPALAGYATVSLAGIAYGVQQDHRRAKLALDEARAEVALRAAERAGWIRFYSEPDCDYEPFDVDEEGTAREAAQMASGELVALVVFAQLPEMCPHCDQVLEDRWVNGPRVGGVVVESESCEYVREIQRELAREAGVI